MSDCLANLHEKLGGSQYVVMKNIAKFVPPWTVPRDLWMKALRPDVSRIAVDARLFHEAGCRLVHKYRVYKDPFPHPALQGGEGVLARLLSFVTRAMAIAQLTHLRISIPASGRPRGRCRKSVFAQRAFTGIDGPPLCFILQCVVSVLGGEPSVQKSPDIMLHGPEIIEEDEMDIVSTETDVPIPVVRPPPGFRKFSWPREEWGPHGEPSVFDFSKEFPGWFPGVGGRPSVDQPSLPVSPILQSSLDDSVVVNVGSSREESNTPSDAVIVTQTVVDTPPVGMDSDVPADSPSPDVLRPFTGSPVGPVADPPKYLTDRVGRRPPGLVPRWRLAREGLAERSSSSLRSSGAGCVFGNTTYRASDYASPSGEFGFPLHHPRFLEWIGAPESAGLLEMGPGRWLHSLSRDQAMDAAIQLHRDVCLMATNLDVLDQYALSLQGTASKMLKLGLNSCDFPSAEVAAGTLGPRVRRGSVQIEAMGLWRPSLDPIRLA